MTRKLLKLQISKNLIFHIATCKLGTGADTKKAIWFYEKWKTSLPRAATMSRFNSSKSECCSRVASPLSFSSLSTRFKSWSSPGPKSGRTNEPKKLKNTTNMSTILHTLPSQFWSYTQNMLGQLESSRFFSSAGQTNTRRVDWADLRAGANYLGNGIKVQ